MHAECSITVETARPLRIAFLSTACTLHAAKVAAQAHVPGLRVACDRGRLPRVMALSPSLGCCSWRRAAGDPHRRACRRGRPLPCQPRSVWLAAVPDRVRRPVTCACCGLAGKGFRV